MAASEKWVVDLARELRILYSKVIMEAPEYVPTVTDGVVMIERALALRDVPQGQWISVEERLPDVDGEQFQYLVVYREWNRVDKCLGRTLVTLAGYGFRRNDHAEDEPDGWRWETHFYELDALTPNNCWMSTVTHWQPLPAAPLAARQVPVSSAEEKGRS